MNSTDLYKDDSIHSILHHLATKFGPDNFKLQDHWKADLMAVGFTDVAGKYLIYICTYNQPEGTYFVSLENLEGANDEIPYEPAGDFEHVDLAGLEELFQNHLRIK